jgi:hypothetical protein
MNEQIAHNVDVKESPVAISVTTVAEILGSATIILVKKPLKLTH